MRTTEIQYLLLYAERLFLLNMMLGFSPAKPSPRDRRKVILSEEKRWSLRPTHLLPVVSGSRQSLIQGGIILVLKRATDKERPSNATGTAKIILFPLSSEPSHTQDHRRTAGDDTGGYPTLHKPRDALAIPTQRAHLEVAGDAVETPGCLVAEYSG